VTAILQQFPAVTSGYIVLRFVQKNSFQGVLEFNEISSVASCDVPEETKDQADKVYHHNSAYGNASLSSENKPVNRVGLAQAVQ